MKKKKELMSIKYKNGNVIRTYKGVEFFEFYEGDFTISLNSYYVYNNQRFNDLEKLMIVIDSEIKFNNKNKINGKVRKTKKS